MYYYQPSNNSKVFQMSVNTKRKETQKDERARAIENNPCSMCRSLGLPMCRGHGASSGGGGSGGGSESKSEDKSSNNENLIPFTKGLSTIGKILLHSGLWHVPADEDFVFKFENPFALLNIKLDMEHGSIVFQSKKELSDEEQEAVDELFDAIEQQFNQFKDSLIDLQIPLELMTLKREGGTMTIKIPSPKYYDAFVQQLMEKNLLPNKEPSLQQQHKTGKQPEASTARKDQEQEEYKSSLPNPFDITRGPKLPDWV